MRIVYVLTSLGMGGAERQVLSLASRMTERGHSVALMVLRPQLKREWPTALNVARLEMRRNLFSLIAGLVIGRRFLKGFQPDVVHSHSFHANLVARLLKVLVPAPLVLSTVHNVYEGGRARMLAYRLTDCQSRVTTAVSTSAAERFVRLKAVPRHKCIVLTNGIDTAEFSPGEERRGQMRNEMGVGDEFVWLTAGRIVPAKDFPNLLRAFGLVRAARKEAQLWIAGEAVDAQSNPVKSFLFGGSKGLMDRVRWLGLRRDMPALMDAADGFVLASAWEGMPLVVGEAMAMEKPVVATDVGGVRELVGDAGMIVPAGNSDALAEAMLGLMAKSAEERHELGSVARSRIATQFSMDARADEWQDLYRDVLSSAE
jgi:glycosyltransferase involved in cell wall biosynthesis